jgi:hypothetical protein
MPYKPPTNPIPMPTDTISQGIANQALGVIRMATEAAETPHMGETSHVLATHLNGLLNELYHDGEDATVEELVTLAADNGLSPNGFRDPRI